MTIGRKLVLSFLSLSLLIGALGGFAFYRSVEQAERVAQREAVGIAQTAATLLVPPGRAGLPVSAGRAEVLQEEVVRLKNTYRRDVVVVDARKRIIADAVPREIGTVFRNDRGGEVAQTLADGRIRAFVDRSAAYPQGVRQIVVPLDDDRAARVGAVVLEYTPLYEEILGEARRDAATFLRFFAAALGLALLIGHLISRRIARPLAAFKEAALKVAAGDLDAIVPRGSRDELGSLAESFNDMTRSLKQAREQQARANAELLAEIGLRKQADEALRLSEEKFRTLFENAADAIIILDAEGAIIDANRTACEQRGFTREEMLALRISDLNPPEDDAAVRERIVNLRREGHASFEATHRRRDGTFMPVEVNGRLIELGGRNLVLSVVRDITERKHAEAELRKTNARLRSLIQAIPDMVIFKDPEGRHLLVNRTVEDVTGHAAGEIIGKTAEDLMPDGPAAACRKSDDLALTNRGHIHSEERLVAPNGSTVYVDMVKAAMVDDRNAVIGMVAVGRDVTDRRRVEEELRTHREELMRLVDERTRELSASNEQLRREIADRERMEQELIKAQKLESLGVLAGGIAHDFNNLLTAVLGNISVALTDFTTGDAAHRELMRAERATLRAQELTQQLLTFSKGGAPVRETASVSDLVRETAGFALRGGRVRCDFVLPGDLWLAEIDAGQMSQVVHNLVINADQAMPEGGTISVVGENVVLPREGAPSLPPGRYVKISVRDSGVGIPAEHLPRIFDPYFTTKQRGSGLGLAMSYSILQRHGGGITVESELGTGTTFSIFLPASNASAAPEKKDEIRLGAAAGRVLIMDDEEDVRETAGSILRRFGYSVAYAGDGETAVGMYRDARDAGAPYDVVIMDLTVPGGMGGREAVALLRQTDPDARAIVSSGYSNDPVMAEYRKYGFAGVVSKPYRMKDLGLAVQRAVERE